MVAEASSSKGFEKKPQSSLEIIETLKQIESLCNSCRPLTPTVCIEHCELWRTKNQLLEVNGRLCASDYENELFNALKNERRLAVIEALSERSRTAAELQGHLKSRGYYHSQHTIISEYVEPLLGIGFVNKDAEDYRLTLYGQRFSHLLASFDGENPLPPHSSCYEEMILRELKAGSKSYAELAEAVQTDSLSRPLKRLVEHELVTKGESSTYVFYFRTKKVPTKPFSPTERRIYEAIPAEGIDTRELSTKVGITLRRTYKYLRRLRKRWLVFSRKKSRTYELTPSGMKLADFLEETVNLVSEALKASAFLLERIHETTRTYPPSSVGEPSKPFQQLTS
jgi:DNA-binding HxlR family transcriptional regulator